MALPMVMEIGLERGFRFALSDFVCYHVDAARDDFKEPYLFKSV